MASEFNDAKVKGTWKSILLSKYGATGFTGRHSPFRNDIMKDVVNLILNKIVHSVKQTLFWHDRWTGHLLGN